MLGDRTEGKERTEVQGKKKRGVGGEKKMWKRKKETRMRSEFTRFWSE
jgi:hypothetical protein